jgi:NADH:ubiquinone oxidoreductase subunit 3 (subunit A)
MINQILLTPPAASIIVLLAMILFARFCSLFSFRKRADQADAKKAYACGEDFKEHLIQPDYSQFFPFAFFFTILHVVALVIATVPVQTIESFAMAIVYIVAAVIGLLILLGE